MLLCVCLVMFIVSGLRCVCVSLPILSGLRVLRFLSVVVYLRVRLLLSRWLPSLSFPFWIVHVLLSLCL